MSRTDPVQWRAFACVVVPLTREFTDSTARWRALACSPVCWGPLEKPLEAQSVWHSRKLTAQYAGQTTETAWESIAKTVSVISSSVVYGSTNHSAGSVTDTSSTSTDNTTYSLRSGLLFAGLALRISLHQTQRRPEQESRTPDIGGHPRCGTVFVRRRRDMCRFLKGASEAAAPALVRPRGVPTAPTPRVRHDAYSRLSVGAPNGAPAT